MPLTEKGQSIMEAMVAQYGKRTGRRVFFRSINKGTIKGVHK